MHVCIFTTACIVYYRFPVKQRLDFVPGCQVVLFPQPVSPPVLCVVQRQTVSLWKRGLTGSSPPRAPERPGQPDDG